MPSRDQSPRNCEQNPLIIDDTNPSREAGPVIAREPSTLALNLGSSARNPSTSTRDPSTSTQDPFVNQTYQVQEVREEEEHAEAQSGDSKEPLSLHRNRSQGRVHQRPPHRHKVHRHVHDRDHGRPMTHLQNGVLEDCGLFHQQQAALRQPLPRHHHQQLQPEVQYAQGPMPPRSSPSAPMRRSSTPLGTAFYPSSLQGYRFPPEGMPIGHPSATAGAPYPRPATSTRDHPRSPQYIASHSSSSLSSRPMMNSNHQLRQQRMIHPRSRSPRQTERSLTATPERVPQQHQYQQQEEDYYSPPPPPSTLNVVPVHAIRDMLREQYEAQYQPAFKRIRYELARLEERMNRMANILQETKRILDELMDLPEPFKESQQKKKKRTQRVREGRFAGNEGERGRKAEDATKNHDFEIEYNCILETRLAFFDHVFHPDVCLLNQ